MQLQKFGVKLFIKINGSYESKDFIPVFHSWIQNNAVEDHLLIDVADYSHIQDGPGVMLVAHEGNFSLDQEGQKPGIMYMRKTAIHEDFKGRFIHVLSTATHVANKLSDNNINKEVDIIRNSFRFIANDRRVADNTIENQKLYTDEVQQALIELHPTCEFTFEDISRGNERLAFTVNFNQDINILEKN